ncbi:MULTISPECIES: hypothetical protein [Microcystis]|jgi:hypothetical protein|uniref:Uncharacterized protein n=2 Tax=Microcystis TaxID=1125 RepID=A0A510PQ85_MICAE|nr:MULTISPECIES: hypothetical protein [Microcystis]MBD2621313.1 hypothetical protein [Microcystis flos-aquae FACHB-1344]MCA2701216.1 hypothetical protein [Microcystis sp. M179S2]GCA96027.1 hypothetical protein MAE30S32_46790 [Microcystis aeruginosa 11-30S32]
MKTLEFLSELKAAPQGWGFWIDRQQIEANHVGQYSFENDRLPKSFVHRKFGSETPSFYDGFTVKY